MLGVMTKPVLVNNFDPIGQFKSGISSGTPWDSIVDFATSKSFCGKRLYPRQMTLLKLIYLETESMTDYDLEVINSWAEGFKNVNNPMGVQPDIWDRIEYLKANGFTHFPHVQMVMGRRASKGIIGSILATERIAWLYSLGSWQQHFNQVPGQVAEITVVANSLTQAVTRQFRDIRNAVFACEYLRPHIVGDKQTEFYIRTPGDEQTIIENKLAGITSDREIATIYCKASSSVSTSGRGGTGLFNAYDEFAHMLAGTGSTKTGEEIYDAFQPSLDQFGHHAMTYCASSPFSKIGKFYDLYQQGRITMDSYNLREGKLKTTSFIEEAQSQDIDLDPDEISAAVAEPTFLVVQLPSWDTYRDWERSREIPILPGRTRTFPRWNSPVQYEPKEDGTPDERVQYRRMRRNPDKFKVERGGQFATVQDAYLNEVMVDRMFEPPDWRPPLEIQHQGKLSLSYRAHADPSRTNANFGFCIAHLEQAPPDEHGISWPHVIIDVLHVWKPEDFKDHTIDYVQVGEELDDYLRRFPSTTKMTYDQFNSAGLIAHQKRAFPNIRVLEKTFTLKENQDRCERFKSALNLGWVHCLAGETGVLTPEGVRPIRDLAGTTARLLTTSHDDGRGGGKWVDAPVQSFGVQPLMKVTLRRNGVDKVIHATANHRWFVRRSAGTASFRDGVLTANLQPGQKLSYCYSQRHKATRPSPIGIAHGFTYGDGTRSRKGAVAQFCGDKDKALIPYFDLHPIVDIAPGIRRALDLPRFFKEKVDLAESPSYLYGWLAGYMAADGHVDKEGYVTISSVDRLSIEHVRAVCNLLGVHTTTITTSASSGGYKPGSHSHVTRIDPTALTEDFFLIEEHRRRWLDTQDKQRKDYRGYTVVSVEETDRVEEVFCAVVDGTQSFTLEDNILTGNCPRDTLADEGQSLLELELKFLQEKNNRVDKQDIGPIQTKDLADAAMVVVTDLLHDSLDKWWTAINRTSVGSTDSVGLRSGRELDRISAYSAPGTGDPMQRYLAEEANRYERKTIRAERNRTVIGANKLERARRKSGQVPTYSNSRTRGFR